MTDTQTTDQSPAGDSQPPERLVSEIEALGQRMTAVREHIGRVIFGQHDVIDQTLSHYWQADTRCLWAIPASARPGSWIR